MAFRTLCGLILCNLIWSVNPVMMKIVLRGFTPESAASLRYLSAFLGFLLAIPLLRLWRSEWKRPFFIPKSGGQWALLGTLGVCAFVIAPLLHVGGLNHSRASDSSLITAMEPLITILLAWLFLRERQRSTFFLMLAVALTGFALLAGISPGAAVDMRMLGNFAILASMVAESAYSVTGRKLLTTASGVGIFGSALAIGAGLLPVVTVWVGSGALDGGRLSWEIVAALLWLGPLGTTATYLYWMLALREATVASLSLTLFIQPVFGALWGAVFLGERLTWTQALGGAFIVGAVIGPATLQALRQRQAGRVTEPLVPGVGL